MMMMLPLTVNNDGINDGQIEMMAIEKAFMKRMIIDMMMKEMIIKIIK